MPGLYPCALWLFRMSLPWLCLTRVLWVLSILLVAGGSGIHRPVAKTAPGAEYKAKVRVAARSLGPRYQHMSRKAGEELCPSLSLGRGHLCETGLKPGKKGHSPMGFKTSFSLPKAVGEGQLVVGPGRSRVKAEGEPRTLD